MALRDTINKWHTAMCLLEEHQFAEAVVKLSQIYKPSAKILYNIGCISMLQNDHQGAIQHFNLSIEQDKYLAIAYFLRGICYHEIQRHDRSELDFLTAQSMLASEGIDYRQLGAEVILTPALSGFSDSPQMEQCVSITRENYHKKLHAQLPILPVMKCIFRPSKKLVENLVKQDFLGRAKVISSTQERDISYAAHKKQTLSVNSLLEGKSVSVPTSPNLFRSRAGPPSRPTRPPPRLPGHADHGETLQVKSKSMENILSDSSIYEDIDQATPNVVANSPQPPRHKPNRPPAPSIEKRGVNQHSTQNSAASNSGQLKNPINSGQVVPPARNFHGKPLQSSIGTKNKVDESHLVGANSQANSSGVRAWKNPTPASRTFGSASAAVPSNQSLESKNPALCQGQGEGRVSVAKMKQLFE